MEWTLKQNQRYTASIQLESIEIFAPNTMVVDRLRSVGFVDVSVEGTGGKRIATGTWSKETQVATVPKQVKEINEL
jgi:hypothetical protein